MTEPNSHTLDDLRQQLHQANERFHALKLNWENWMNASEYRHEERVNAAREELQHAER